MDKGRIITYLNRNYLSRYEIAGKLPLGMSVDDIWKDILEQRLSKKITLPLHNHNGEQYWYVLTDKMIMASEKIVEELMENDSNFTEQRSSVSTLEEVFFTGYLEGMQIPIKDAMSFLQSGNEPEDVEELILLNNLNAGNFVGENLHNEINGNFIHNLAYILTDGLECGSGTLRTSDTIDIPSMRGESFEVPAAHSLNFHMDEFICFLADPNIHPLIKASAAQSWFLITRPYPEGNERLARISSYLILVRTGYTFFRKVSLSALIAKKSRQYFNAAANIIRSSSQGDLTYFLEYYLIILSDAVDELRERRSKKHSQTIESEKGMAQLTLGTEKEYQAHGNAAVNTDKIIDELNTILELHGKTCRGEIARLLIKYYNERKTQFTSYELMCDLNISRKMANEVLRDFASRGLLVKSGRDGNVNTYTFNDSQNNRNHVLPIQDIKSILISRTQHGADKFRKAADLLLEYLDNGKYQFSSYEISDALNCNTVESQSIIKCFKRNQIIRSRGMDGCYRVYEFCIDKTITASKTYSESILKKLSELSESKSSPKDRRIGNYLTCCLDDGAATLARYLESFDKDRRKWCSDMHFAAQMGLVRKVSSDRFEILTDLDDSYENLAETHKATLSAMYDIFGSNEFSAEMVVAKLDYSSSHVNACLHQLTWLKVLDCKKENSNALTYKLLVNPKDNPECFESVA